MGNISFNTAVVKETCRTMNTARRNIVNQLNFMKSVYSSVTQELWAGSTRKYFHKNVFGEDDQSGYLGSLGTKENGLCGALNALLYMLSSYVCEVSNADNINNPSYQEIKPEEFVDDTVKIEPVNYNINYSELKDGYVAFSLDIADVLEQKYQESVGEIKENVTTFNTALRTCMEDGIQDDSVEALSSVMEVLETRIEEFSNNIRALLRNNVGVVNEAEVAKQRAQERAAQVNAILERVNIEPLADNK